MVKTPVSTISWGCMLLSLMVFWVFPVTAFEKLPPQYYVSYGDPTASLQVTEYFSLSCPKCLETFKNDFTLLKQKYLDTHQVHWTFHLNPADLLTLQAMTCLEQLSPTEKQIFWEVVLDTLSDGLDDPTEGCIVMQAAMDALGKPIPQLSDLAYLEKTPSFQEAYRYLKQKDTIQELPTVEINGKIYDEFPHFKFLDEQLSHLSFSKRHS